MTTAPSPDTPRPKWMNGIHWETTPPFRVEWLSKVTVEFFRVGHLKNKLNENLPVLVGKDGQEIEEQCGRALLYEMQAIADLQRRPARSPTPEYRGREGYGRGRGGGYGAREASRARGRGYVPRDASRGRQGFIKREEDRDTW